MGNERVNWRALKILNIESCWLNDQTINNVLSGCPSLESSELKGCVEFDQLVIACKSLKKLVLSSIGFSDIEISCPNLKELYLLFLNDGSDTLLDKAIENALCACPVLESLEINDCDQFDELVNIASASLKRLVLKEIYHIDVIETLYPNLEELKLSGALYFTTSKLTNLPSLNSATLDFEPFVDNIEEGIEKNLLNEILLQLQHVKELKIEWQLFEILSALEVVRHLSCPLFSNKHLTLASVDFDKHPAGFALPELVLTVSPHWSFDTADLRELNDIGENYWKSNESFFKYLVSHLKILKIIRLSKRDEKCMLVLNFIDFLLKNARVLEKLVVEISEERGTEFAFNVSEKLLTFPRCSRHAIVELSYAK